MFEKYRFLIYLVVILLTIVFYIIYKLIKKDLLKDKVKILKNITLILTTLTYFYVLLSTRGRFIYEMTFSKAILISISLALLIFSYGLIKNKDEIYNKNVNYYIILYLVLLLSITIFIGRMDVDFSIKNFKYFSYCNKIPFKSIIRYFEYNSSMKLILKNIGGNIVMLIPLSFLLMIKNKKYNNILNQIKIILPIILCIEFLQLYSDTGVFDIDDIILNLSGVIIFTFLITRFHLIDRIRNLFYKDLKLNKYIKYSLFIISLIIPMYFIIDTVKISIKYIVINNLL